ncbi:alpha/beta hydrolase [Hymenobacter sediminicola]|uniref:Alpha/beta hydrolase n=1 Tax=Hymenobacter sediminicola TaxID=2761579 RepID=A0A7G7W846_9BACT|nr:alpha/beta hydrolase-fold protein [Hymenobacter sediminicola]QNH62539.1 alpha/beta hydrolase [Hymenobacter sediminicola]
MRLPAALVLLFWMLQFSLQAQTMQQKTVAGRIEHIESFASKLVEPRTVDVWLPANYDGKRRFAVLYMHDGQMLFDSTTTWNHQAWNVDDVVTQLQRDGQLQDVLVVGVWNAGARRHANYFPQKPFEQLTTAERDTVVQQLRQSGRSTEQFQPNSDAYLRFLVTELKPFIDRKYRVYSDRQHTFVAGSSMGGLISMYALCEYPAVFGGAACLSTHWPGTFTVRNNPMPAAFLRYLRTALPDPRTHKLYFDCGDQTLDALYPAIQREVDAVVQARGYTPTSWQTRYVPGQNHSEKAWNQRLDKPLLFLLGK